MTWVRKLLLLLLVILGLFLAGCNAPAPVDGIPPVEPAPAKAAFTETAVPAELPQADAGGGSPTATETAAGDDQEYAAAAPALDAASLEPSPAEVNEPAAAPQTDAGPTPEPRKDPKYWAEWPLIPTVSARAREIYALGQQLGNDPHSFTTIGDCQSEPSVFMGIYDTDRYFLGEGYEYLEETIRQFKGSFQRDSVTVKDGMSVASVLSPAWADTERCESGETPLECEIRLHRPVIAFINLGTNWQGGDDVKHEAYMRQVVDILIENGVVPVISTKGDNLEGDHRLNRSMARVAYDYDLPLWNFWRSLRDLPGKGIDGTRTGGYLTTEAWARRSFTGLQALDAVWRGLSR